MTSPRWRRSAGALAIILATSVVVANPVLAQERPDRGATSTPTPDERAANGLLVGDPSLIPDEEACVAASPNPPWIATIAAF